VARGDHIYVRRGRYYTHHAIDVGDGTVIHYTGTAATGRRVERSALETFADGGDVFVRTYRSRLPPEEIISRAESRLGMSGYHLVRNNCEHFATWASTGSAASRQVRSWAVAAPGAVASLAMAQAAGIHVIILGTVSMCAYALRGLWHRRSGSRTVMQTADIDRDCAA
jgi:hypothetical protein